MSTVVVDGRLGIDAVVDGRPGIDIVLDGEFDKVIKVTEHDLPVYTGQTNITPTTETQTLQTANKSVLTDIVIEPIPNNYGLITWDGSKLTIS